MSDQSSASTSAPPSQARLTSGCIMLLLVGFWLVALGAWMAWHVVAQVRDMRNFTDHAPQTIQPEAPTGEALADVRARVVAFGEAVKAKSAPAKLELSVADLNHLLSAQEPVNRLKDILKVEEITDSVKLKVALALNGIPMSGERLFLNGYINARPEVKSDTGLVLLTRSLEVPGKTVSEGFTASYLQANHVDGLILDELRKEDKINAILTKISIVRCEPGKVVLEYTPPAPKGAAAASPATVPAPPAAPAAAPEVATPASAAPAPAAAPAGSGEAKP